MALIKCPNCGKEISDKAKRCVHCGYILKDDSKQATDQSEISKQTTHDQPSEHSKSVSSASSEKQSKGMHEEPASSPHSQKSNKPSNNHTLVIIMGIVIAVLAVVIVVLVLKNNGANTVSSSGSTATSTAMQSDATKSASSTEKTQSVTNTADTLSTAESNAEAQSAAQQSSAQEITYNKALYDGDCGTVVLDKISNNSLTLTVTSKLKNRECSFYLYGVALDGEGIMSLDTSDMPTLSPGQTTSITYSGDIRNPDHQRISLTGEFFDDQGTGTGQFEVTDADLGGNENLMYSIDQGTVLKDFDSATIRFVKFGGKGIRLLVTNKTANTIDFTLDSLKVDGKAIGEDSLFLDPYEVLGNTSAFLEIDLASADPDIAVDQVQSVSGTIDYISEQSGDTLEQFSFDIKN